MKGAIAFCLGQISKHPNFCPLSFIYRHHQVSTLVMTDYERVAEVWRIIRGSAGGFLSRQSLISQSLRWAHENVWEWQELPSWQKMHHSLLWRLQIRVRLLVVSYPGSSRLRSNWKGRAMNRGRWPRRQIPALCCREKNLANANALHTFGLCYHGFSKRSHELLTRIQKAMNVWRRKNLICERSKQKLSVRK